MRTFWVSLRIAARALLQNKARSILTLLGMIIGVGAVIAIVSLGEGLRADFTRQMSSLGADVFYMTTKAPKRPGQAPRMPDAFEMADIEALRESCPSIAWISPSTSARVNAQRRDKLERASIIGFDERYLEYSAVATLAEGRFYTKAEYRGAARVVVIGDEIADDLFDEWEDPIGGTVKLDGMNFTIIGRFEHYSGMIGEGGDINNSFVAPLSTLHQRIVGGDEIYFVSLFLKDGASLLQAKEEASAVMRQRRRIRNVSDDDFQFISPDDFMELGNQFINVLIGVFGAIAFMSLLVGGVGIMNIMLVSVTERTREIGLRMALGAGRPTVLSQFLVEAILLTIIGGLLGMGMGYAGAFGLSKVLENAIGGGWQPFIPFNWVCYAIGVSVLVGVVFGTYPAFKASRLDPVEAMRYE